MWALIGRTYIDVHIFISSKAGHQIWQYYSSSYSLEVEEFLLRAKQALCRGPVYPPPPLFLKTLWEMLCFSLSVFERFVETCEQVVSAVLLDTECRSVLRRCLCCTRRFYAIMAAERLCSAKAGKAVATRNNTLSILKQ